MNIDYIGKRITALRLQKEVSEYKMSYDLGHNKNYIRSITSGRALPSISGLFEIISYFNLTPAEFFDEEQQQSQMLKKANEYMRELDEEDMVILLTLLQLLTQKSKRSKGASDSR